MFNFYEFSYLKGISSQNTNNASNILTSYNFSTSMVKVGASNMVPNLLHFESFLFHIYDFSKWIFSIWIIFNDFNTIKYQILKELVPKTNN